MPHYFFMLITQLKSWILFKAMEKVTDKRELESPFAILKENYQTSVNICFHLQQVRFGCLNSKSWQAVWMKKYWGEVIDLRRM